MNSRAHTHSSFAGIATVHLVGLLLGGLYVGLIAPLRTVVQDDFGIDSTLGIWMINIYTLFYAAVIPVIGGLADRYGRRPLFIVCSVFFALGSLVCGLANMAGGWAFGVLLAGRVVQAVGAGGLIPTATAEIGSSAPAEKRGMWLGIAAMTSGLANVLGASVGSVAIAVVGMQSWELLFYAAVPVGIVLAVAGWVVLPRRGRQEAGKLDFVGAILLAVFVIMLLLALDQALEAFPASMATPSFALFFVVAMVCLGAFIAVERRSQSPIFHLEFFSSPKLVIIMVASLFLGVCIISMQLIPEFAEYALSAPAGSGGYYMTVIGIFAIVGPVVGGRIIDKRGARIVLIGGCAIAACGFVFLATVVAAWPSVFTLMAGLAIVGLGLGFSTGTPTNYLCLQNVSEEKSTTAIATITLIRQMGTTLGPAILVSFTTAGNGMLGYSEMLFAVAVANLIVIALMLFYPSDKKA